MISSDSSTISGLRRRRTPAIPVENRIAEIARYQGIPRLFTPQLLWSASTSASSSERIPSTTPPTAATNSTIDVISNARRWSVRNSRPISAGEPNARVTDASSESRPPAFSISATNTTESSAAAAITDAVWIRRVPPAHVASARPPR